MRAKVTNGHSDIIQVQQVTSEFGKQVQNYSKQDIKAPFTTAKPFILRSCIIVLWFFFVAVVFDKSVLSESKDKTLKQPFERLAIIEGPFQGNRNRVVQGVASGLAWESSLGISCRGQLRGGGECCRDQNQKMFENFVTKVVRNFQSNSYELNSNFVILQISKKEIKLFNIYCNDPIFYEIAHYFYLIS